MPQSFMGFYALFITMSLKHGKINVKFSLIPLNTFSLTLEPFIFQLEFAKYFLIYLLVSTWDINEVSTQECDEHLEYSGAQ